VSNDPRVGLRAGLLDAEEATSGMQVLGKVPAPDSFFGVTNSDIAFTGQYAVQGNYRGFLIWDVSTPSRPTLVSSYTCPASQNDVSVYKQQILVMSAEGTSSRLDCGTQGVRDTVSAERIRGVRIFDMRHPEPEVHHQCPDLPRLAHPHGGGEPERPAEHLRLHLRLGRGAFPQRDAGVRAGAPGPEPQFVALPHRSDPDPAGESLAGGHRGPGALPR
jgi:hypothetical protein